MDDFSHHIGNVIIPTDELHHFSEGLKPPTNKGNLWRNLETKNKGICTFTSSHGSEILTYLIISW